MTFDPKALDWEELHRQLQINPDKEVKKRITKEMLERVWNGPDQPENRIPSHVFDPSW